MDESPAFNAVVDIPKRGVLYDSSRFCRQFEQPSTSRARQCRSQARVGELKESMAKNKQALAQCTWEETVKIILEGAREKGGAFPGPRRRRWQTREDVAGFASRSVLGEPGRKTEAAHRREEKRRIRRVRGSDEGASSASRRIKMPFRTRIPRATSPSSRFR